MNIYEEILGNLTNSSSNLQDTFLKLKILAKRLKNDKLKCFVESELNGYDNDNDLPSYRKVTGVLMGTVENLGCRRPHITLPTSHLEKYGFENINICYFPNKLTEIEGYADENDLNKPVPPELYNVLSKT